MENNNFLCAEDFLVLPVKKFALAEIVLLTSEINPSIMDSLFVSLFHSNKSHNLIIFYYKTKK